MCRDMRSLGVNEFSRYLKRRNVVLIDVRTPEEYAEGHIPGTDFNINVLDNSFEREILDRISPDSHVAIYCRSGNRSKQAAEKACAALNDKDILGRRIKCNEAKNLI